MVSLAILVQAGGAVLGGLAGLILFALAGSSWLIAFAGGVMAAGSTAAVLQATRLRRQTMVLEGKLDLLRTEMADIIARDEAAGARLAEVERRTIESPAMIWRAASTDIDVLGTLVSDLARTVAAHERRLGPEETTVKALKPASVNRHGDADDPASESLLNADLRGMIAPEPNIAPPPHPAVVAELRGILASALASDRLELCLQPVVELPQRKIRGYEATLRLRGEGGDLQSDADLRRIASTTGLEADLDRVLLERAMHVLRVLRGRKRAVTISCAVKVEGFLSPNLPVILETALRNDPELARAIVFEVDALEFRSLAPETRQSLRALADQGVGLSVGCLPHLKLDIETLTGIGIRQIKVSADAMLGEEAGEAPLADIHPADISEFLRRRGIELQMFDVASEQILIDSLDYAPRLASGPLFGQARPVRPEVIEPRAVSDAGAVELRKPAQSQPGTEPSPAPSDRPQRQSFRSVLRRA